jgi:hypothetical protein
LIGGFEEKLFRKAISYAVSLIFTHLPVEATRQVATTPISFG